MADRRAVRPLNMDAVRAADAALAAETGGRPLTLGPKDAALREKWMDAYVANGGKAEFAGPAGKKPDDCVEPCPLAKKAVSVRIVSLTFRSDHLDAAGKKLLKRSPAPETIRVNTITGYDASGQEETSEADTTSIYGDNATEFRKPEWDADRSTSESDPISHTKNQNVVVDIELDVTVTPAGQTAVLTEVQGVSAGNDFLSFQKAQSKTVKSGRVKITKLTSKGTLPNFVTKLDGLMIDWSVVVDGETIAVGGTGPHRIYVTYDKPGGKMGSPANHVFLEGSGAEQVVSEARLEFAVGAAEGSGVSDEKECVDAVFRHMSYQVGVGYVLGRNWIAGANTTGITPKPTLHHYLWLCNTNIGQGECHNIAASFALECKILGVKGPFLVGYMYPWSSRKDNHPTYDKRGDHILGKYDTRCERSHSAISHQGEYVVFLDGNDKANNFEGVARYRDALYAIGDAIFDGFGGLNENVSAYFAERESETDASGELTGHVINVDFDKGGFDLQWARTGSRGEYLGHCDNPYPGITPTFVFRWEE